MGAEIEWICDSSTLPIKRVGVVRFGPEFRRHGDTYSGRANILDYGDGKGSLIALADKQGASGGFTAHRNAILDACWREGFRSIRIRRRREASMLSMEYDLTKQPAALRIIRE